MDGCAAQVNFTLGFYSKVHFSGNVWRKKKTDGRGDFSSQCHTNGIHPQQQIYSWCSHPGDRLPQRQEKQSRADRKSPEQWSNVFSVKLLVIFMGQEFITALLKNVESKNFNFEYKKKQNIVCDSYKAVEIPYLYMRIEAPGLYQYLFEKYYQ